MEVPCLGALQKYDDAISAKVDAVTEKYKISKEYVEKYAVALAAIRDLRSTMQETHQSNRTKTDEITEKSAQELVALEERLTQENATALLRAKEERESAAAEHSINLERALDVLNNAHASKISVLEAAAKTGNQEAIKTAVEDAQRTSADLYKVQLETNRQAHEEEQTKIRQQFEIEKANAEAEHLKEKERIDALLDAAKAENKAKNEQIAKDTAESKKKIDAKLQELETNGRAALKLGAFLKQMEDKSPEDLDKVPEIVPETKKTATQQATEAIAAMSNALLYGAPARQPILPATQSNGSKLVSRQTRSTSADEVTPNGVKSVGGTRRKKRRKRTKRRR